MNGSVQHFIRTVRDGMVVKVQNISNSRRRKSIKMKTLRDVYGNLEKPRSQILIDVKKVKCEVKSETDEFAEDEDDLGYGITLNHLKNQLSSKKRKSTQCNTSSTHHSENGNTTEDDDDNSDLKEPLIKLKPKRFKTSVVERKNRNICSSTNIEEKFPVKPEIPDSKHLGSPTFVDDIYTEMGVYQSPCLTEFDSDNEHLVRPCFVDDLYTEKGDSQNPGMMELDSDQMLASYENKSVLMSNHAPHGIIETSNVGFPNVQPITISVPWNESTVKQEDLLKKKIKSARFSLFPWHSTSKQYKLGVEILLDLHNSPDKKNRFYSLSVVLSKTGDDLRFMDTKSLAIVNSSSSFSLGVVNQLPLVKQASSWIIDRCIYTKPVKSLHLHSRVKMLPCSNSVNLHEQSSARICSNRKRKNNCAKLKISTGCTSLKVMSENAIAFSRKQMHDTEKLVEKLMNQLKEMKGIVEEKVLFQTHRNVAARNGANEVISVIKKTNLEEERSRKFLSVMTRDCNRFCKIMELTPSNESASSVSSSRQRRRRAKNKRKITFADEVGGKLCHVKFF